jgi:crossover junction endodeoxyribonuclease RuvC
MRPRCAVVERVASMPKQGVASTFKFGMATGIIHGVLAACDVPVHLVTPSVWKRGMGLIGADKEASRALALRLFPQVTGLDRKMDHGRAEALLMGHWFMLSRSMGELPS